MLKATYTPFIHLFVVILYLKLALKILVSFLAMILQVDFIILCN